MSGKLNILLADDSAFMRLLISDILSEDKSLQVVGTAEDGKEAVEKVKALEPDILVLDMNMGEYDGIYAVKRLMKENPLPILILSAVGNTDLAPIFDALKHGAVDYMNKPSRGNAKMREMNAQLIQKIKSAARAKPKAAKISRSRARVAPHAFAEKGDYDVLVIGASTGGPSAIEEVIGSLPPNLNIPVLIGQHMPSNFIAPFVKRLNHLSPLQVTIGRPGMSLHPGEVIVAPGDANMTVVGSSSKSPKIAYDDAVYREYNNPSINALMASVAVAFEQRSIGVLLTGMGKDGVTGLKKIYDAGGFTIAQDQASCVIHGMPKAAVEMGAVREELDIKRIGEYIIKNLL